ncbi:helix-turn-helix domain-containing protein [Oxyplasma meridianum]|uniref:Helix-turn-helix domain-containing protein n=1 Tax=Oxyplasma meridianum TaxID=3073602 RepID=A0AAX4NHR4_9ARCH
MTKYEMGIDPNSCPIVSAIREIGGEWNFIIIRYLLENSMGFNEILRNAKGISSRTLSAVLKDLAGKGIVKREIISTQPFLVRYSITEKGNALRPIVNDLGNWGRIWITDKK